MHAAAGQWIAGGRATENDAAIVEHLERSRRGWAIVHGLRPAVRRDDERSALAEDRGAAPGNGDGPEACAHRRAQLVPWTELTVRGSPEEPPWRERDDIASRPG